MCDTDDDLPNHLKEGMHYIPVPMKRGISFDGVKVIMRMKKIFECEQFDIIQYATPNAALYASIAANMAGMKNRLYTHWGSRYMGYSGGVCRFIFFDIGEDYLQELNYYRDRELFADGVQHQGWAVSKRESISYLEW